MAPLLLKFAGIFAVLGLVISVAFGVLGGNRLGSLIVTAVVCTVLSGGLGVGTYKILEQRVPEVFDFFGGGGDEAVELDDDEGYEAASGEDGEEGEFAGVAAAEAPDDSKAFGDQIIVDKIKIKNEPRLMAQAIKTLLARDSDKA